MSDWRVWQLVDSAFPAGAFVHSGGLESAWQHGEVTDADGLRRFVGAALLQAGHGSFLLMNAAHRDPERLAELDSLNDAFLTNVVANRASRVQGRTWLATSSRVWPSPALAEIETHARTLSAHIAPVMGASLSVLDVPLDTAQRVVLYAAARGALSAAVRLGIVGSYEAQRMQSEAAGDMDTVLDRCGAFDERDLAQTAPTIDLLLSAHDRLYSRLFQS